MSEAKYAYDVALSFAGEDRVHADALANLLQSANVQVFYDSNERSHLWGEDLYQTLADIYSSQSTFCVMFLSKHYAEKSWTIHERRFAQERALIERNAYILPIKLDDTKIPGIPSTISSIDLRTTTIEEIFRILIKKIEENRFKTNDSYSNIFNINEDEIRDHIKKYNDKISKNPFDSTSIFSLGVSYLRIKSYDFSIKRFKKSIELTPENPDCYYYYALSLIKGRRVKTLRLKEVKKIQELIDTSIKIAKKSKYYYLAALINYDFYESNGLKAPKPDYIQLIYKAKSSVYEPEEIQIMLDNITLRDESLKSVILNN